MKGFVSIIIPIHNGLMSTLRTIGTLDSTTKYPHEVIFVESESTDGVQNFIRGICDKYPNIYKVIWGKKCGIPSAINEGMKQAKGDVYLTQNDVIFPADDKWLDKIVETAYSDDKIGIVATMDSYREAHGWGYGCWVGTWSMFIKRETIDKIGMFDETFNPGCGDDIDYCQAALKAGLDIKIAPLRVYHNRDDTEHFNDNEELKKRNEAYYRKKWGT